MGNTDIQPAKMQEVMLRLPKWAYDELHRYAKAEAERTSHPITKGSLARKVLIDFLNGLRRHKS